MPSKTFYQPLRSCLYECRITHDRLVPKRHRFCYGLFWFLIDLDELPKLHEKLRCFGIQWFQPYRFLQSDHFDFGDEAAGNKSLSERLRNWLNSQGFVVPSDSRIFLLTLPRFLGYVFNPVSFFFLETPAGQPILAVAEVGNTFGEKKPYVIPLEDDGNPSYPGNFRRIVPKHFYVSPFSSLDVNFDFRLRRPTERLELHVDDLKADGEPCLVTSLTGVRQPLTDRNLAWLTLRYPLVTLRVIALIHWEALRLWRKRVPWFRKSDNLGLQKDVIRPASSLSRHAKLAGRVPFQGAEAGVELKPVPAESFRRYR